MHVPFVDLKAQYKPILNDIKSAVECELTSCSYVYSKANEQFEIDLANFVGANFTVGCASGTAALHLALSALDIGQGDEVIVPVNSFIATALAVSYTGATPVFADVNVDGSIDMLHVMSLITDRTKAIIPVHLYGHPVDIKKLRLIVPNTVYIIEDAAQALGGLCNGDACGNLGDIGCVSFYPAKNLGACGQGGAVICNDDGLWKKIKSLANVGRGADHYNFDYIGFNYRLDSIKAAFLGVCLKQLKTWNTSRNFAAKKYIDHLSGNTYVMHYRPNITCLSTYHLFVIHLENKETRDILQEHLKACDIDTGIHYPIPIHKTKAYKDYNNIKLKIAEDVADRILSLPMFPTITNEQIEYVSKCINQFFGV